MGRGSRTPRGGRTNPGDQNTSVITPTQGGMPGWTGGQSYTANANLPNPNQFRAQQQAYAAQQRAASSPRPASYSAAGGGKGVNMVIVPQRNGPTVTDLRARSAYTPGGLSNLIAGPYTGNTPMPQFLGQRPTVLYNTPENPIGPVPARDVAQSEGWRNVLGLRQGVTYQTQMPMFNGGTQAFAGNRFIRNAPYQPPSQYALGARGDNGPEDRALLQSRVGGPWGTPYGNMYYSVPQTDFLNQNPQLGATGVFDDTLKSRGTGTTTDLYNPVTLQGRRGVEGYGETLPVADRSYDAVENVRLNRGAPSDNLSEAPTMPPFGGYTDDDRGRGGGGGGGGYGPRSSNWYNAMMSWRI